MHDLTASMRIDTSLQLGSATDEDPLGRLRRLTGLVIGDAYRVARYAPIEPVNRAPGAGGCVGNGDRDRRIPRQLASRRREIHIAEWHFGPASGVGLGDLLG